MSKNGIIAAITYARQTLDALFFVNKCRLLFFTLDGLNRAFLKTNAAFFTLINIHLKFEQCGTSFGRACLVINMRFILVFKILEC